MDEEPRQPEPAPEGSHCAEHPDRDALVTCPRCGNYACLGCWHGPAGRCQTCLIRDPLPPVPWADASLPWHRRFLGTLGGALSPTRSAPGFLRGSWQKGITFALLTALPLALLSGIIPFTHRLAFGGRFGVQLIGQPTGGEIALDVLQAAGVGLLLCAVKLVCLSVPFVSLTRAYGRKDLESRPAIQVMLYRAWLVPLGGHMGLLLHALLWSFPLSLGPEPSEGVQILMEMVALLSLMILLWAMSGTARVAGAGPFASLIVAVVPFVAMFYLEPLTLAALSPWLPDNESIRQAVEGATNAAALTNP